MMMDKDLQKLSDSDLEAVAGGISMSVFLNINDFAKAQSYLASSGIDPGNPKFNQMMELWINTRAQYAEGESL